MRAVRLPLLLLMLGRVLDGRNISAVAAAV